MSTTAQPRTFYQVLRLHQLIAAHLDVALAPAGFTASQYTVLSLVRNHGPVSSADLARRLGISAQSVGETVKALEARLLVSRRTVPGNRRTHALTLTPQGKRALGRADGLVLAAENAFFSKVSTAERAALEDTIRRLRFGAQAAAVRPAA